MANERDAVEPTGPMKPVMFQVLLSLAECERHGYGIVQDIAARSAARMRLEPGNLYRTLKAMMDVGLIAESDLRPAPELDDERRRYYRITPRGRQAAAAEAARLEELVAEARARRLLVEPGRA